MAEARSANRVPKNKPETYKDFTKGLNQIFKSEPDDAQNNAAKKLAQFCDSITPKADDGSVQWILPLAEEIPNHTVVLLAHSIRPIRCIGEITKNEQCSKAIPLKCRYIVEKLVKRDVAREEIGCSKEDEEEDEEAEDEDHTNSTTEKKKRKKKKLGGGGSRTKKRRIETVMVECGKKQQQLISKKKGFWVIWKPSFDAKILTTNLAQHMETVLGWYELYVNGMEKNPSAEFPREGRDMFREQFMLNDYPTPDWQKHTQEYQKTNRSHDNREEPPPPPPPPLLPSGDSSVGGASDDDDEDESRKEKKKRKRGGGGGAKKRLCYEPVVDIESSARELQTFDTEHFFKFMESFRDPPPTKNDSLNLLLDDLGDLPNLDLPDDILSM